MDSPLLLVALLGLPLAAAALIVAVSSARRRRGAGEPRHRLQADPAAVQDAAVYPADPGRRVTPGRERRGASSRRVDG